MLKEERPSLREYELVMVLSPEMDEEGISQQVERINQFITEQGGGILKEERWGKRKLAYPIQKFSEGSYVLTQFTLTPELIQQMDTTLKVSEDVIRHLLTRKEG